MNAIVIEHVPVSELPAAWRSKLGESAHTSVTVRIEAEAANTDSEQDPLFGLWRNHADLADVQAHVRGLRAARFGEPESHDGQ